MKGFAQGDPLEFWLDAEKKQKLENLRFAENEPNIRHKVLVHRSYCLRFSSADWNEFMITLNESIPTSLSLLFQHCITDDELCSKPSVFLPGTPIVIDSLSFTTPLAESRNFHQDFC